MNEKKVPRDFDSDDEEAPALANLAAVEQLGAANLILEAGGAELVAAAMMQHPTNAALQAAGLPLPDLGAVGAPDVNRLLQLVASYGDSGRTDR